MTTPYPLPLTSASLGKRSRSRKVGQMEVLKRIANECEELPCDMKLEVGKMCGGFCLYLQDEQLKEQTVKCYTRNLAKLLERDSRSLRAVAGGTYMVLIKESPENRRRHGLPYAGLKHFQDFFNECTNGDMSDTVKFEMDPTWEDYATLLQRAKIQDAKPHLDKSSPDLMQGPAPRHSHLFRSCRAPDRGATPLTRQKARSRSMTPPSRLHGWGGPRADAVLGPRIHFWINGDFRPLGGTIPFKQIPRLQ